MAVLGICFSISHIAVGATRSTVQVVHAGPELSISVTAVTDLYSVLDSLCTATNFQCDMPTSASSETVPVSSIRGTWNQVAETLLQGTHFDYVLVLPSTSQALGKLLIRQQQTPPPRSNEQSVGNLASRLDEPGKNAEAAVDPRVDPDNTDRSSSSAEGLVAADAALPAQPPETNPAASFSQRGWMNTENLGSSSSGTQPSNVLVWPTADGRPIVAPSGGSSDVLPWPDAQGHAIAVQINPEQPVLPWPDANGNPVPVKSP